MIREFLQNLGLVPMPRDAVQVWDCDPLVVVDDDGELAFSGRCEVEFAPAGEGRTGRATALAARDGWRPTLNVVSRLDDVVDFRYLGQRAGFTLRGTDDEGYGFTWYVNHAADRYLTTLRKEELPGEDEVS